MKPQSAKAKGRKLQQDTAKAILKRHPSLEPDDVRSTGMGQQGEDIQLSPAARKLIPLSFECKSRANFAFYKDLDQAVSNCPKNCEPVLVAKANHRKPVVIIDMEYFLDHYQPRKVRSRK